MYRVLRENFRFTRRVATIFVGGGLLVINACAADEPDGLRLTDELSRRAVELQASDNSTTTVEYHLKLDVASFVAMVPSTGLQKETYRET